MNTDIVSAALRYQGAGYRFGGAPARGAGNWDCSSFVNWVIGHDLGMAIPGYKPGKYTGSSHGPVVAQWAIWQGVQRVKGRPSPGDLVIWPGVGAFAHMGIAVNATHMISAMSTHLGTIQTPIAGNGPGPVILYRRLRNTTGSSNVAASFGTTGGAPPPPYPAQGKFPPSVTVGGRKIYLRGPNDDQDFKLSDWPVSAVSKMARWEITAKAADPDKYSDFPTTQCRDWLAGHHTSDNAMRLIGTYADVVGGLPSVGTLPGEGTATNAISSVADFLQMLLNPHLWVRIAEVVIGVALVAIGAAHMSGAASTALKATPIGKVL